MKTTNPDLPFARETDSNSCILRLERNNQDLFQLRNKLNSYLCEPKTYTLFERVEALRIRLENLMRTNWEIRVSIRKHNHMVTNQVQQVKQQLSEFRELEQSVSEYMMGARNC